ncbi:hypothetical protein GCM10028807_53730 [Spirosoma daeguense]
MKRPTDKQQEHEWIERYLHGQMAGDERITFEAELTSDPSLRQEVDLLKRTHQLIQEAFLDHSPQPMQEALLEQNTRSTLKELQAQNRQRINRIRLVKRSVSSLVSAGFILILYLSLMPISFPDSENDINVTRSLSDDSTTNDQNQVFGQFFEGQTHLTEGQYALAVENFERVLRVTDIRPYFREAAQWHLAVAYLKSGEPDKAERVYDQFSQCISCEYTIGRLNRWKIWWQIKWSQWLN